MNTPIIMLHHIANQPHSSLEKWCISHEKFLELLNCIEQKGLQTTTFQEIVERKLNRSDLANKVIISFDDCPATLFDFAIPELIKRGMKAVFYMPTEHIDGVNTWDIKEYGMISVELMNVTQLKKLVALGMEVGSHGEKHIKLDTVTYNVAYADIVNSKYTLEKLLEHPTYSFAYPYGKVPMQHEQMLKKAGYKFGLSIYTSLESNFTLRRFAINEGDDRNAINLKLSKRYQMMRSLYDPLFLLLNKLLSKAF
ncbi:polysaccharide deacetylase family protein [Pedobacter sp. G11]|nr:polysaccharide deacetylase family protein [Pedobacter sp. G11]